METRKQKKAVFIAHPVSGDVQGNIAEILRICKEIHSGDIIPVVPYLVSLQYLDDNTKEDRELGIEANHEAFYRGYIDELWLFGDRISTGMEGEIELALKLDIPIIPKTKETKGDLAQFISKIQGSISIV